ncbi:MAG: hypothetical protein U1G08_00490 [Verrucomicrobiota bacterium]
MWSICRASSGAASSGTRIRGALRRGELAVVTLAAAGLRRTGGAGTRKALHPYAVVRRH